MARCNPSWALVAGSALTATAHVAFSNNSRRPTARTRTFRRRSRGGAGGGPGTRGAFHRADRAGPLPAGPALRPARLGRRSIAQAPGVALARLRSRANEAFSCSAPGLPGNPDADSQSNKNRSARIRNSKGCQLPVSYASLLSGAPPLVATQAGCRVILVPPASGPRIQRI